MARDRGGVRGDDPMQTLRFDREGDDREERQRSREAERLGFTGIGLASKTVFRSEHLAYLQV